MRGRQRLETKAKKKKSSAKFGERNPMDNLTGLLRLRVRRGVDLVRRDAKSSDPYVVVTMASQKLKTRVVKDNCNPEWDDELTLAISDPHLPVKLVVYDKDKLSKDDTMGEADIDIVPIIMACREMELLDGDATGKVVTTVCPNTKNCLYQDSNIVWKDGKLLQDMSLRLNNVERGRVEIQLEWTDLSNHTT